MFDSIKNFNVPDEDPIPIPLNYARKQDQEEAGRRYNNAIDKRNREHIKQEKYVSHDWDKIWIDPDFETVFHSTFHEIHGRQPRKTPGGVPKPPRFIPEPGKITLARLAEIYPLTLSDIQSIIFKALDEAASHKKEILK